MCIRDRGFSLVTTILRGHGDRNIFDNMKNHHVDDVNWNVTSSEIRVRHSRDRVQFVAFHHGKTRQQRIDRERTLVELGTFFSEGNPRRVHHLAQI